jgi:DNA polymerase III delta subunit
MRLSKPLEFCNNPPPPLRALLLYGQNESLKNFYLSCLKKALSVELQVIDSAKHLPTVSTPSLFSKADDRQLIYISTANDRDLPILTSFMEDHTRTHLLVIATSLPTKSKLVTTFLEHKTIPAIACYDLKPSDLKDFMTQLLQKQGIQLTPEALLFLTETFCSSPELLWSEFEKLSLYQGGHLPLLDLAIVKSIVEFNHSLDLEALTQSLFLSDIPLLLSSLTPFLIEEEGILIIRTLIKRYSQLFELLALCHQGMSPSKALEQLSTPVFFQLKPIFLKAVDRWSLALCAQALECLFLLEKRYKSQEYGWTEIQAGFLFMAQRCESQKFFTIAGNTLAL